MKFRILPAILGIISISAIALPLGAETYKVLGTGTAVKVYKTNQTALAELTALVTNSPKPKVISTNKCGWGKFKESVKSPVNYFGTDASNPITITAGNTPVCTKVPADPNNPGALPTYTSTEDAPVGTARRTADGYIFYKGANIQTAVSTLVGTGTTKKAKANQCGLVAFNLSNGTDPVVTISIAGETALQVVNMASKQYPQKCSKVGAAYVLYNPDPGAGGLN